MNNEVDTETFNFILENVKLLRNIQSLPSNPSQQQQDEYNHTIAILTLLINTACNEITIKTNRIAFPKDLRYLAIDIVNDAYGQYLESDDPSIDNVIQSMSEDGRSINFGASDYAKSKMTLLMQQKIKDNEVLINRYRLLYKIRRHGDEQN